MKTENTRLYGAIRRLLSARRAKKRRVFFAALLACAVVFTTVFVLMLPAITAEEGQDVLCVHTHTDDCYEKSLVCPLDECEESCGHTHTDACYETRTILVCGLEESEEHTHTDDCYAEEKALICGQEETEATKGHTHGKDCYQRVLVCGPEERDPGSADTAADKKQASGPVKQEIEVRLTASLEPDLVVTVTGPASSFPADTEHLTLVAKRIDALDATEQEAAAYHRLNAYLEKAEHLSFSEVTLIDLTLFSGSGEAELLGPVSVTVSGLNEVKADVYHVSNSRVEDLFAEQNEENDLVFEVSHFSLFGIVIDDGTETNGELVFRSRSEETTNLTVKKVWSNDWETHDPVTITLMHTDEGGNSVSTGRTLVLNPENSWTGVFDGLPVPEEGEHLPFSVVEEPVSGYVTQYSQIKETASFSASDYWIPVMDNQLRGEGVYLICSNVYNQYYLMNETSGSSVTPVTATGHGAIELGGAAYSRHFLSSEIPAAASFKAIAANGGFLLQNVSTGHYLRVNNNALSCVSNPSNATVFTFQNGRLFCQSGYVRQWGRTYSISSASNATAFQLYEHPPLAAAEGYEVTVTNTRIYPQQGEIEVNPEIHKTIDYLGDGGVNPDTALEGEDYYRLYLDLIGSHQPVDLLIVADMTYSMTTNDFNGTRQAALDAIVNGTILSGSGANAVRDTDGIVYNFLSMHPENKVAVTGFSGGNDDANVYQNTYPNKTYEDTKEEQNPITLNWTGRSEFPNGGATPRDCYARVVRQNEPAGTNYEAALMRATEMLNDPGVTGDGHIKVMIFLTDGEPNVIFQNGYLWKDTTQTAFMQQHTREFFVNFIETHPGLVSYIVGISSGANSGEAYRLLSGIAQDAHITYYPANNASELHAALREIVDRSKFSLVEIKDELSAYVEYYAEMPDLRITRTDRLGNTTVIWENGGPTADNVADNGVRILNYVTFTPTQSADSTGKVSMIFNPDCMLDGENTFTLSYNVKLTQYAKDFFAQYGYPSQGDPDTDFCDNETSSLQPGFYSNHDARVTFTAYDRGYEQEYPHPVVQTKLATTCLTVKKLVIGAFGTAQFPFEVVFYDQNGDVITSLLPGDGYLFDPATGKASFHLTHDQSVTILDIPVGAVAVITETGHDGYLVLVKEGEITLASGDTCTVPLNGEKEITFVNNAGTVLPETGGAGNILSVTLGGGAMIASVLMFGYSRRKKERRFLK